MECENDDYLFEITFGSIDCNSGVQKCVFISPERFTDRRREIS